MDKKRKNVGEIVRYSKRLKAKHDSYSELEGLPVEVAETIYQYLPSDDLKNLLLVSKTVAYQVKSSTGLMRKFILDLNKAEIGSTRSYRRLKLSVFNPKKKSGVSAKKIEQNMLDKLVHFGSTAETMRMFAVDFPTLRFSKGFDHAISSLRNLRELELSFICFDVKSKMTEDQWTFDSLEVLEMCDCDGKILKKFKSVTSLKKFNYINEGHLDTDDCKCIQEFIENQTRLEVLDLVIFSDVSERLTLRKSKCPLKELHLCSYLPENSLDIEEYIKINSSSLNSVELGGMLKPEIVKCIFNELKVLKHLHISIDYMNETMNDKWNILKPNYTVQHLKFENVDYPYDEEVDNCLKLIPLFPNVVEFDTSFFTFNECWRLISIHMKKLESVRFSCPTEELEYVKIPSVKKVIFVRRFSQMDDDNWAELAECFPNVEEFTLERGYRYPPEEIPCVEIVREIAEKYWKNLKICKSI